ncbi:MAG: 3-oxoacyl-ACP reductase FabG [Clostridia bacterium]|nr:3-oxoacyl-ACP reductase FabG [Clostridia bacterium]
MSRRVIVTGGGRGIGAAIVRHFAAKGDRVAFIYRSNDTAADDLCRETGALSVKADISSAESAQKAAALCIKLLGGTDILINNAGIAQIKLFDTLTDEDWRRMIDTNLSGTFYVTRAAVKEMLKNHSGRIINIGSMWGKCGASCEVHYSASKAGLRGFTAALAKELGPSGITVNCIEPGVIATEMNAALDEETVSALCEETPVCRMGTPEDVVNAVDFFASDASSFITGQILGVDGGYAI